MVVGAEVVVVEAVVARTSWGGTEYITVIVTIVPQKVC